MTKVVSSGEESRSSSLEVDLDHEYRMAPLDCQPDHSEYENTNEKLWDPCLGKNTDVCSSSFCEGLSHDLIGINNEPFTKYIECVADHEKLWDLR